MPPDNDRPRTKATRDEYEVADSTKERGRPLQRKMLQHRFDESSDGSMSAVDSHGEEPARERGAAPPPEDRAG